MQRRCQETLRPPVYLAEEGAHFSFLLEPLGSRRPMTRWAFVGTNLEATTNGITYQTCGTYTNQQYASPRQPLRDLHPALDRSAFDGMCDGQRDEPAGKRLLPCHAWELRRHGEDGLLPDGDPVRRTSSACRFGSKFYSSLRCRQLVCTFSG